MDVRMMGVGKGHNGQTTCKHHAISGTLTEGCRVVVTAGQARDVKGGLLGGTAHRLKCIDETGREGDPRVQMLGAPPFG